MKAKPDKYHLFTNNTEDRFEIKICDKTVTNSDMRSC